GGVRQSGRRDSHESFLRSSLAFLGAACRTWPLAGHERDLDRGCHHLSLHLQHGCAYSGGLFTISNRREAAVAFAAATMDRVSPSGTHGYSVHSRRKQVSGLAGVSRRLYCGSALFDFVGAICWHTTAS